MDMIHKKTWLCMLTFISLFLIATLFIIERYVHGLAYRLGLSLLFSALAILFVSYLNHYIDDSLKHKSWKYLWTVLFIFYIAQLSYLLFLDPEFARDRILIVDNYPEALRQQWLYSTNLVPFYSIRSLWYIIETPGYLGSFALTNLLGNLIAFMPFSLFLPILFKRMRKITHFFIVTSLIIISVELLQFLSMTGSMDIDDYILNILGCMILYIIVWCTSLCRKIPYVKKP